MLHQSYTKAADTDIRTRFARVVANAAKATKPPTQVHERRPPLWVDQQRASYDWGYFTGERDGFAMGTRFGAWIGFAAAVLLAVAVAGIGAGLGYFFG